MGRMGRDANVERSVHCSWPLQQTGWARLRNPVITSFAEMIIMLHPLLFSQCYLHKMEGKDAPEKPQFVSSKPPPLVSFEQLLEQDKPQESPPLVKKVKSGNEQLLHSNHEVCNLILQYN